MKSRLLLVPLALAGLVLAAPAASASAATAAGGELRLGFGSSKGLRLGASITLGPGAGRIARGGILGIGSCQPAPPTRRIWIPARSEVIHEQVYVPGCERRIFVPARYETHVGPCGSRYTVEVAPAHWQVVREPGRWERVARTVHHPGHWGVRG